MASNRSDDGGSPFETAEHFERNSNYDDNLRSNIEPTARLSPYSGLRKKILQIHARTDLTSKDKDQQVQLLMRSPILKYETLQKNTKVEGSTGFCAHYQRNCLLYCDLCDKFYACHICHDEAEEGRIFNRFNYALAILKCTVCDTIQSVHQNCSSCGTSFGHYFCRKCLLMENDITKRIFHCDDCGICRIGEKSLFFHCQTCKCCLNIALKTGDTDSDSASSSKGHKCIERSLESNCPICGEYLFTSRTGVIFMACGHAIHYLCHEEHIKRSYQCPVCLKSLADMRSFFSQLDELVDSQPMPMELSDRQSSITCNDCMRKSLVDYHLSQYHKCLHCHSYNTSILEIIKKSP
ncbi:hypothetical protein MDAP_001272 [Mitosporidium daphniae]